MGFRLSDINKRDRIKHRIVFDMIGDLGKHERGSLTVEYKKYSVSEFERLSREMKDETTAAVMAANILNIEGLIDNSDEAVPFSASILEFLMDEASIRAALVRGFFEIHAPVSRDAQIKN